MRNDEFGTHPKNAKRFRGTPATHPTKPAVLQGTPATHPTKPAVLQGTPATHPTKPAVLRGTPGMRNDGSFLLCKKQLNYGIRLSNSRGYVVGDDVPYGYRTAVGQYKP